MENTNRRTMLTLSQFQRPSRLTWFSVFVWQSDGKFHFPKLNFSQFANHNVKILVRRLNSTSLKDVAWLEVAQLMIHLGGSAMD